MSRLPFDLSRVPAPPPADSTAGRTGRHRDEPLSVGEVAQLIKGALDAGLPTRLRVVGEVSNFSNRTHWFFSLKDATGTLNCVCFASSARRIRSTIANGEQVIATGRIDFYEEAGRVQLYVDAIEPVGAGPLEVQLRKLMEELREAGFFAAEHKRPLPPVPRRIAVVTSRSAAALQDVIDTARRRFPPARLLLYDVRVQGTAAAGEIAAAVRHLSEHGPALGIDAILLTRGGGSIEDLWAFNERIVAEALRECRLPTVAAIGHETDLTVAELVADVRAATPTQAVMALLPEAAALEQQVRATHDRLRRGVQRRLDTANSRLDAVANHPIFRRPAAVIDAASQRLERASSGLRRALTARLPMARAQLDRAQREAHATLVRRIHREARRIDDIDTRLRTVIDHRLTTARSTLDHLDRTLHAIGPHKVLQRGYTYTLTPDGSLLRDAADARAAGQLTTVFHDGRVNSTVTDPHSRSAPRTPRPRRSRKAHADDAPPTLFADDSPAPPDD